MVANWRNPDFQKILFFFFVLVNFWAYAAVSVSSEGPAPLHVGSVSVGVASVRARGSMAQVFKRHHLRLAFLVHPRSLRSRSLEPRVSSLASSPAQILGRASSRRPLRLLRDRGGLSSRSNRTSIASGGTRTWGLSSRSQADCSVAGSRLEPSAWPGGSDSHADPSIPSCVRQSRCL